MLSRFILAFGHDRCVQNAGIQVPRALISAGTRFIGGMLQALYL